eukprot:NODE_10675_length_1336_cov_4.148883.p2 GENE.NODE_10675_length_1336_cov_4.148883~~NODE_10675_length_1336_cov_4.148883.p2  ORF type:complete len:144 (+),score=14.27 NODE_10675_length_1336_cov_4.148883:881-1312(+)
MGSRRLCFPPQSSAEGQKFFVPAFGVVGLELKRDRTVPAFGVVGLELKCDRILTGEAPLLSPFKYRCILAGTGCSPWAASALSPLCVGGTHLAMGWRGGIPSNPSRSDWPLSACERLPLWPCQVDARRDIFEQSCLGLELNGA